MLATVMPFETGASAAVLAVADGMGGAYGGDVASRTAIEAIRRQLTNWRGDGAGGEHTWLVALREGFTRSFDALRAAVAHDDELAHMGTTLTCLVVADARVSFAHVGDSRAYLFRDGDLRQLTTDHNVAQELAEQGQLGADEAATDRSRQMLTRWLAGDGIAVEPETGAFVARPNDLFLLCTDGLYTVVSEGELEEHLRSLSRDAGQTALDALTERLITDANTRGGRDNISVVLGWYGADATGSATD